MTKRRPEGYVRHVRWGAPVFAALAVGTACAPLSQPAAAAGPSGSGLAQIEKLIGTAPCSSDAECRVIGVGAKACGGPEAYRAWSTAATDAQALQAAVDRDAQQRRAELQRQDMRSNCSITPVPAVACVPQAAPGTPGRCTLVSPAGLR